MALVVFVLWPMKVHAEPGSRDAWLIWATEGRPVLMLGPRTALLPGPSFDDSSISEATPLWVCVERGCEPVSVRERMVYGGGVFGLELTVEHPLADVAPLADAAEIRSALRASAYFGEGTSLEPAPLPYEEEPPVEPAHRTRPEEPKPEVHESQTRLAAVEAPTRRERSPRRRRSPKPQVDWSAPSRWSGEYGAMSGLTMTIAEDGPRVPSGFASVRGGFRYLRRFRSGSYKGVLLVALSALGLGNQVGADLRVHYLGSLPEGHHWAVTTHPAFAIALPERRAAVAGRVSAPLGLVAFGVGGVGRDVGFVFQPGIEGTLLVTPHLGLDLRCFANIDTDGEFTGHCGLGGFFR